jgi:hypothetical protein
MTSTCATSSDVYSFFAEDAQQAMVSVYNCVPTPNPAFLPVTVQLVQLDTNHFSYDVMIGTFNYQLSINPLDNPINYSFTFKSGITIDIINNNPTVNAVHITVAPGVTDTYLINLAGGPVGIELLVTPTRVVSTIFSSSPLGSNFSSNSSSSDPSLNSVSSLNSVLVPNTNCNGTINCGDPATFLTNCSCLTAPNCGTISVPIISILGNTTPDLSDIGTVIFTICDEFLYYKEKPIHEDRCVIPYIKPCQVKQTKFLQCCPFIVSVLKGKGATAYEKAAYIYNKVGSAILGPSSYTFYLNLILYAMAVYILSRILYGHFNINYVLGKHYKKFLHDLGHSRFCAFLQVFLDCTSVVFKYNKFFKFDHKHKDSSHKSTETSKVQSIQASPEKSSGKESDDSSQELSSIGGVQQQRCINCH